MKVASHAGWQRVALVQSIDRGKGQRRHDKPGPAVSRSRAYTGRGVEKTLECGRADAYSVDSWRSSHSHVVVRPTPPCWPRLSRRSDGLVLGSERYDGYRYGRSSVQFSSLHSKKMFSEAVGLLEQVGFKPSPKLPRLISGDRKWAGSEFRRPERPPWNSVDWASSFLF